MPIAAPTGAGNVTTYTSNASTSCTLAKPASIANGDVLVAAVWGRSNTTVYTAPTGWAEIAPAGGDITGPGIMRFYTRVITDAASEPASYTWSGGVSGRVSGVLFRVTGANTASVFDVPGAEATAIGDASSSSVVLPGLTSTAPAGLLVAMTGAQISTGGTRGAFAPPAGWTVIGTTQTSTGAAESDFGVAVLPLSAAGATGAKTFTRPAASAAGLGFMAALKALVALYGLINGEVSSTINATAGQSITFTASAAGGNGNPITYGWNWGDGTTTPPGSATTVTHTYATGGTYTVTMTPYQS